MASIPSSGSRGAILSSITVVKLHPQSATSTRSKRRSTRCRTAFSKTIPLTPGSWSFGDAAVFVAGSLDGVALMWWHSHARSVCTSHSQITCDAIPSCVRSTSRDRRLQFRIPSHSPHALSRWVERPSLGVSQGVCFQGTPRQALDSSIWEIESASAAPRGLNRTGHYVGTPSRARLVAG